MNQINTFKDYLVHQLRDLLFTTEQMTMLLPKMASLTEHDKLRKVLDERTETSQKHSKLVKECLQILDARQSPVTCEAMVGIITEGDHLLDSIDDKEVRDSAIIATAQRMQHYEITGFGTAKSHALQLDEVDVAEKLETVLKNEKKIDKKLTKLAEKSVNKRALAAV